MSIWILNPCLLKHRGERMETSILEEVTSVAMAVGWEVGWRGVRPGIGSVTVSLCSRETQPMATYQ